MSGFKLIDNNPDYQLRLKPGLKSQEIPGKLKPRFFKIAKKKSDISGMGMARCGILGLIWNINDIQTAYLPV
jgi:hypothetical protein